MLSNRKILLYLLLLAGICISAYILFVVIPSRAAEQAYDGARRIGQDIRDAFQFTPKVTVNNTVVLEQQKDVFELALTAQSFRHEYDWTNTWMGSTKRITIKGSFEAKAGFDLDKNFQVDIDDDKAVVTVSEPVLLSITPQSDISFADEQGLWNWVSPEDRTKAINAFNADARRYAQDADFIAQARRSMEAKLTEIFAQHGKTVEVRYADVPRMDLR